MQSSFNLIPKGIIDLEQVSKNKNVEGKGLKALAACCKVSIRKDSRVARSKWGQEELTHEQVQYAAEEAYFAHHIYGRLSQLPQYLELGKHIGTCLS